MQECFDYLTNDNIDEAGATRFLATAGAAALLTAGMLMNSSAAGKHARHINAVNTTRTTSTHKDASISAAEELENRLRAIFKNEYEVIKAAAIDNNCFGDDFLILLSIRKTENGRPGREFGILHPKAIDTDLNTQARWAAATVVKNRKRWKDAKRAVDFITFLGRRYAPIGVDNDKTGLNKNWITNVTHWRNKLSSLAGTQ